MVDKNVRGGSNKTVMIDFRLDDVKIIVFEKVAIVQCNAIMIRQIYVRHGDDATVIKQTEKHIKLIRA